MRLLKSFVLCAAALSVSSAFATPVTTTTRTAAQIMGQVNAVVSNTFTSAHDVEGRLVANEIKGGATFYNQPKGVVSDLAAVNAITIDAGVTGNINNSGNVNYVSSNGSHFSYNGGALVKGAPVFSMSDFTAPLNTLASQLAGMSTTAGVSIDNHDQNSFLFKETGTGVNVFNISSSLLSTANNIQFSGSASTIIINVTGNYTEPSNANFNANDFLNTHVIWNFVDATSLNFKYWHGAILAGNASVTNSSPLEGFLYAKDFTGNGELHNFAYQGWLPAAPVPEPSSVAMLGVGLIGVAFAARKRAKSA